MPPSTDTSPKLVTAVILAGGAGRRMGGIDKGLATLADRRLIEHALERILPQVGNVVISANRNIETYSGLGPPVLRDDLHGFQGPLAGIATALTRIDTPLLLTLPCDSPLFPCDLVQRLHRALEADEADIAVVHDGRRIHPVFALMRRELLPSLLTYLAAGHRKVSLWFERHRLALVDFSDEADAFRNINTPTECAELETHLRDVQKDAQNRL